MRGSCLCGAIEYQADALAGPIVHCHCRTCQKAHAAAFATTVRVNRKDFRWLKGEASLAAYESTAGKLRRFCSRCGSQLISEWLDQPQVIVRVATLDADPRARPAVNIWASHDLPWLAHDGDLPSFAEFPPPKV